MLKRNMSVARRANQRIKEIKEAKFREKKTTKSKSAANKSFMNESQFNQSIINPTSSIIDPDSFHHNH
jgi:hypothetical protein